MNELEIKDAIAYLRTDAQTPDNDLKFERIVNTFQNAASATPPSNASAPLHAPA